MSLVSLLIRIIVFVEIKLRQTNLTWIGVLLLNLLFKLAHSLLIITQCIPLIVIVFDHALVCPVCICISLSQLITILIIAIVIAIAIVIVIRV